MVGLGLGFRIELPICGRDDNWIPGFGCQSQAGEVSVSASPVSEKSLDGGIWLGVANLHVRPLFDCVDKLDGSLDTESEKKGDQNSGKDTRARHNSFDSPRVRIALAKHSCNPAR